MAPSVSIRPIPPKVTRACAWVVTQVKHVACFWTCARMHHALTVDFANRQRLDSIHVCACPDILGLPVNRTWIHVQAIRVWIQGHALIRLPMWDITVFAQQVWQRSLNKQNKNIDANFIPWINCKKGFTGPNCQSPLSACYSYPCVNGLCDDLGNFQYSCLCFQGYTGPTCAQVKNVCDASPCMNGGICIQTSPGVYACQCPPGYMGFNCQTQMNICASSPCQNNGLCIMNTTNLVGFQCICMPPYTGMYCNMLIDPCSTQPCGLNGYCASSTTNPSSYICNCKPGYTGSE